MHRYLQEKGQNALLALVNEDIVDGWRTERQMDTSMEKQSPEARGG